MKAFTLSPLTSLILRIVGILLILSYLLDAVVLLIGANFQDNQWVLTLTSQLVDRGFIPMLAIAFLFMSLWVEEVGASEPVSRGRGLKLTALWLASVLALMFLLLVPLHINTTRVAADNQINQLNQDAESARKQLDGQLQQAKGQLEARLATLDQAIKSNQLPADQLAKAQQEQQQLQKFKSDPKALEAQLAPSLKQVTDRRQQLESQTRANALRSGMRVGLSSLLLAIGYAVIGWLGLRQLL